MAFLSSLDKLSSCCPVNTELLSFLREFETLFLFVFFPFRDIFAVSSSRRAGRRARIFFSPLEKLVFFFISILFAIINFYCNYFSFCYSFFSFLYFLVCLCIMIMFVACISMLLWEILLQSIINNFSLSLSLSLSV